MRRFVFQTFGHTRRTQDSPIAPDVWVALIRAAERMARARHEGKPIPDISLDVLITPWRGATPGEIASYLRQGTADRRDARAEMVALNAGYVVASVDLGAIVVLIIPMTDWWQNLDDQFWRRETPFSSWQDVAKSTLSEVLRRSSNNAVQYFRFAAIAGFAKALSDAKIEEARKLVAIAKKFAALSLREPDDAAESTPSRAGTADVSRTPVEPTAAELVLLIHALEYAYTDELEGYTRREHDYEPISQADLDEGRTERTVRKALREPHVQAVNQNRPAAPMLFDSRRTVKADAAQRLFEITTDGITFAIIDGGIDATHPGFLDRSDPDIERFIEQQAEKDRESNDPTRDPSGYGPAERQERLKNSRVVKSYDFTRLRAIQVAAYGSVGKNEISAEIKAIVKNPAFRTNIEHLNVRIDHARDLDWTLIEPLIEIRHDHATYKMPRDGHGTHVAGILAADLRKPDDIKLPLQGMCPALRLYDLRVFDDQGRSDEFTILSAVEFVAWLNRNRDFPVVHGANMSLALQHYVDSYACGRTPICEACNRLVGSGTVVVVAAGNTGFDSEAKQQSLGSGYRSISITDPGNADAVITVGSTHRRDPHAYGVSYFSSRGPTGDGRRKPDLVAPGEKITSTVLSGKTERMDGTSMAAPHVSGAAALLMARNPELIGQPAKIKEVLMRTATDLGRARDFQGAGLVDVLRALQSI